MINRTFSTVATMVALGILTPINVHAFGLGKLELSSALNEPFKAQIPVTALREDEEGNLQVRLATTSEFTRAGIERSHYLTQLVFTVIERPGGATIEISSQQPIKEPFVDFLLTTTTGEGRLLREYTVLLDPPKAVFTKSPSRAPTNANTLSQQTTNKTTYQAPESSYQPPTANYYSSNSYGPTKRDDTLWDIALATKPSSSVTVHQMMLALLDANPDAFINNNINNLKTGYTLNVPSLDEVTRLTHGQAVARVNEQYQQWKKANNTVMAVEESSKSVDTENNKNNGQLGEDNARLQLVVDGDDSIAEEGDVSPLGNNSITKLRDQLTLAQETIEGQEQENIDFKSRMDAMEKQLKIMQRIVMLKDADLARLQGALGEDEKIELASDDLSDEMKNALGDNVPTLDEEAAAVIEELAGKTDSESTGDMEPEPILMDDASDVGMPTNEALMPAERMLDEAAVMAAAKSAMEEAEFSGSGIFVGSDSVLPIEVSNINDDTLLDVAPSQSDSLQAERFFDEAAVAAAATSARSEQVFKDTGVEVVEAVTQTVENSEAPGEQKLEASDEQEVALEEQAEEGVEEANTNSASEPIFIKITSFIAENKTAVLGGLGALFLGLVAWLFSRRRNKDEGEYEWVETDSLADASEVSADNLAAEAEDFEITMNDSESQSIDMDVSPETLGGSQEKLESVSDFLNQAEMSIAYGEYEDAHALVEKARVQEPASQAVALKLIALAYHQKQPEKFNKLLSEVDVDKDSIEWKEITEWSKELAPSNEQFTEEGVTDLDLTSDVGNLIAVEEDIGTAEIENIDTPLEFSLNDSLEEQAEEVVESEDSLSFDADFDLGDGAVTDDISLELDAPVSLELDTEAEGLLSGEALLDIDLETPELAEEIIKSSEISDELAEVLEEKVDTAIVEPINNGELPEMIDSSLDDEEEFDIGTDDLEFDIGDFDEVDEAETKLDLAAAYVDMGDPDGAKNILNEVLQEGNDEQKSRAQDLLNSLA